MVKKINKLAPEGLRISLFRLYPDPDFERGLMHDFFERLGKENVAIFKVLGHYDVLCCYPYASNHTILFGGSIKGIRSFANIDCIYQETTPHKSLIKILGQARVISIITLTLSPDQLKKEGGVINDKVLASLKSKSAIYLNSFSWGDQILIVYGDTVSDLLETCRSVMNELQGNYIDRSGFTGVELQKLMRVEKGELAWSESLRTDIDIQWQVKLIETATYGTFWKKVQKITKATSLSVTEKNISMYENLAHLSLHADNWGTLMTGIRLIRKNCKEQIESTRLNILWKEGDHV